MHATIVRLHVDTDHSTNQPADEAALALDRLSAFLDAEGPLLERLLRLTGHPEALSALAALNALHCEDDSRSQSDALEDAGRHLRVLLRTLEELPIPVETVGLVPGADLALVRELDAAVRWHGARVQEMVARMDYALG